MIKIVCAVFHQPITINRTSVSLDLRGPSRIKPVVGSMEYDPATGEVVITTTAQCGHTGRKPGRIRIPASNVAEVLEEIAEAPAKPVEGKKAA